MNRIKRRRTGTRILAAAALASAAISGGAAAQLQPEVRTGSRLPVKPIAMEDDETRRLIREFARCVASGHRALAAHYVLDRSSLEIQPHHRPLLDGRCVTVEPMFDQVGLRLPGETFRFALAEALLQDELATINADDFANAPALALPQLVQARYEPETGKKYTKEQLETMSEHRRNDQAALILYKLGDCAARTNPKGAKAVLQAAPDSPEELAAIRAGMPAIGSCLESGLQLKLDRARLRGALAFGYYSLAHAWAAKQNEQPYSSR